MIVSTSKINPALVSRVSQQFHTACGAQLSDDLLTGILTSAGVTNKEPITPEMISALMNEYGDRICEELGIDRNGTWKGAVQLGVAIGLAVAFLL